MQDVLSEMFTQLSGWNGLNELPAKMSSEMKRDLERDKLEAERQAAICARALNTPEGFAFLQLLAEKTVWRRESDEQAQAMTVEAAALFAKRREGQNSIFFMILEMLNVARGQTGSFGAPAPAEPKVPRKRKTTHKGSRS